MARGYSGYVDQLLGNPMRDFFRRHLAMEAEYVSSFPDLFALALVLALTVVLSLGARESTRFNNVFTCCNLLVVAYAVVCGSFRADWHNWNILPEEVAPSHRAAAGAGGFWPFGLSGVVAGAATCFFGFQGFDSISTASEFHWTTSTLWTFYSESFSFDVPGEEAENPRRTIPLAICLCLLVVFVAYSGVAIVLTLMWPYYLQVK